MAKKIVALCLAICIICIAIACDNTQSAQTYEVKLFMHTDSKLFNSDVLLISNPYKEIVNEQANSVESIMINDNTYRLNYSKSLKYKNKTIDIYESTDKKFSCKYNSFNHKLISLYAGELGKEKFSSMIDENKYIAWCNTYLSSLGINSLSEYVYSCKTGVVISSDNSTSQEVFPYFYETDKSNEEVSFYEFYFTRYCDSIPTSDEYSIYIRPQNGTLIVNFSSELFTKKSSVDIVDINSEQIRSAIQQFLKKYVNDEYTVNSYNIKDYYLDYIDGKLCYVCGVEINYLMQSDTTYETITDLQMMTVYLE